MPLLYYGYKKNYRRKHGIRRLIILAAPLVAVLLFFVCTGGKKTGGEATKRQLLDWWQEGDYGDVFKTSSAELEKKPMDFFLLTLHGFSAYQLAIAQINAQDTQRLIDAAIWSLRKALLTREGKRDSRIFYVLGKAYYYKGLPFMDLAVSYLETAAENGYPAGDINEYLGLSYAALEDYQSSVEAFSRALQPVDGGEKLAGSDIFLVTIARSYFKLGEFAPAKAYLTRALEVSRDYKTMISARLLLGNILTAENDYSGAEKQYVTVLNDGGESAEARYYLGEVYALQENNIKARAEWRKALRIDPAYAPARERLNI